MEVSNCCNAPIVENTDLCSLCLEHCTPIDEELAWLDLGWTPIEVKHYTNKG